MKHPNVAHIGACLIILCLSACGEVATSQTQNGFGANPTLPAPNSTLIPTVNIAVAKGWAEGEHPIAASGLKVTAYARDLDHPRWIYVLPNGDVLVAESDAPPKPDDSKGLKGWIMKLVMKRAGSGAASANRITLLRNLKPDGSAESRHTFLSGLNSPFGMALIGDKLYVANTDAVVSFPYRSGDTVIDKPGTRLLDLPAGTINHHWTKNLIASRDGKHLYVAVGSNSNVAENGISNETNRAAIWEIDAASGEWRLFASGLRNPVGMSWEPHSGALWTVVNERDDIGNDLVPDYMTSVKDGAFYGWPYSYFGQHVDLRARPPRPDLVAKAIAPDFAIGAHTASLGLAFYTGTMLPARFDNGAFIGQHGSWNRNPRSGYKVIFVTFSAGQPTGKVDDVLTGFLSPKGEALGRPVGVAIAKDSALLVADDVGNIIWRVTADSKVQPISNRLD